MIKVVTNSDKVYYDYYYSDYFQNKENYFIFLTSNLSQSKFLDEVNNIILEKFIGFDFTQYDENELEPALNEKFVELNWRINSIFREKKKCC